MSGRLCPTCGRGIDALPTHRKYCSRQCYLDRPKVDDSVRLWPHVDCGAPDECWPWTGQINRHGYGRVHFRDRERKWTVSAHRLAWEVTFGPVPAGMVLDHVCHTHDRACFEGDRCPHRRCCNPNHLEPVTNAENARRQNRLPRHSATHCKKGHEFTEENTYIQPATGYRLCRECQRAHCRASAKRRREMRAASV